MAKRWIDNLGTDADARVLVEPLPCPHWTVPIEQIDWTTGTVKIDRACPICNPWKDDEETD